MTTWYLIIVINNGIYGGAAATYVPFSTEQACVTAREQIINPQSWTADKATAYCAKDR